MYSWHVDGIAAVFETDEDKLRRRLFDEAAGALHGYEIARRIEQETEGLLRVTLAALYPMLYRECAHRKGYNCDGSGPGSRMRMATLRRSR